MTGKDGEQIVFRCGLCNKPLWDDFKIQPRPKDGVFHSVCADPCDWHGLEMQEASDG